MPKGTLYLLPVTLGEADISVSIPAGVSALTKDLRYFIVEEVRTARRFLRRTDSSFPIDEANFAILNEHSREEEIEDMLAPLLEGHDTGLMSESGLPGIADPGAKVVKLAHRKGIGVKPMPGPSSIILGLIASGLNGQSFTFQGYLPVKPAEREKKIREIEARSRSGESQIFIEAPYRNRKMFEDLKRVCKPSTILCIAAGITTDKEYISTRSIGEWQNTEPPVEKIPAVFILQA